jgi:hypothetical protein
MSEKLEKLDGVEWQELILGEDKPKLVTNVGARQIMSALNATIDRVNELEARYESHTHGIYIEELGSADSETYAPRDNLEAAPNQPGGEEGEK